MASQKKPPRPGLKGNRVELSFVRRGSEVLTVIQLEGGTQRLTFDEADLAELRQLLQQAARSGAQPDLIEGKMITGVRPITAPDQAEFYWFTGCPVLELDDGATLYAAQDEEGNGPGCFWVKSPDGRVFSLHLNDGKSETAQPDHQGNPWPIYSDNPTNRYHANKENTDDDYPNPSQASDDS